MHHSYMQAGQNFMMAACRRRVLSIVLGFSFYCLLISILLLRTYSFSQSSVHVRRSLVNLAAATLDNDETIPSAENQCQFCGSTFKSRNGLFRHLNTDERCASKLFSSQETENRKDDIRRPSKQSSTTKVSLFLKISYTLQETSLPNTGEEHEALSDCWKMGSSTSDAKEIGKKVQEAVELGLRDLIGDPVMTVSVDSDRTQGQGLTVGTTQTSVANHRPSVLAQERCMSSASDFLLLNLLLPEGEMEVCEEVDNIIREARKHLVDDLRIASGAIYSVNILSGMQLSKDFTFHAEKDCTQRIYHYLLPVSWLPDGALLESWCQKYDGKSKPPPPTNILAKLREALQLAESKSIPNRKVRRRQKSEASSDLLSTTKKIRKGSSSLNTKERLPWHNFGNVELRGDASPNQEPVWNVLDKARIKGFLLTNEFSKLDRKDDVLAVLEFRGDNFLPGQIQSIVGTAVAVVHGWLPPDIFSMALSKDFLLETPTAPKDRLYSAGARFHSHEIKLAVAIKNMDEAQVSTFQVLEYENPTTELQRIQKHVLERVSGNEEWLEDLKNSLAPRIKYSMLRLQEQRLVRETDAVAESLPSLEACISKQVVAGASKTQNVKALVQAYQRTLRLLRDIIDSGSWPETSMARSNVIREEGDTTSSGCPEESKSLPSLATPATGCQGGSFTVFNTQLPNNPLLRQMTESVGQLHDAKKPLVLLDIETQSLPLGNQNFPELVEAVFDLERVLSESGSLSQRASLDGSLMEKSQEQSKAPRLIPSRPPSLCCAVNANASFLPHVDSGRGAGQSLSLIVGLGDYDNGGRICVEDYSHDIRYQPLEFDGWSSRHWTEPYRGERFSLVFFSPAISDTK